jgi:hypothetical protein
VAPLYPLFLAGIYWLFGPATPTARLVQELFAALATSAGIALLPLVGRRTGLGATSGVVAGLLLAVLPVNLYVETTGSWEQPYAALLLTVLLLAFAALHEGRWESGRLVVVTGLLLAGVALLSPSSLPAGGLMLAAEWWAQRGRRTRVVLSSLVMLLICLAAIAPWAVRNYYALGGFVPLRSNFGLEIALGNRDGATGKSYDTAWDDADTFFARAHPYMSREVQDRIKEMGELAYMREQSRIGREWIREHPGPFAALTLKRFQLFWFPPVDMWSPSTSARLFKSLAFSLLGAGAWGGLALLLFSRNPYAGLWAAVLFGGSFVFLITHVDLRYRYPVFGLSALLACYLAVSGVRFLGRLVRGPGASERASPVA